LCCRDVVVVVVQDNAGREETRVLLLVDVLAFLVERLERNRRQKLWSME
jgi:hypothetical protein